MLTARCTFVLHPLWLPQAAARPSNAQGNGYAPGSYQQRVGVSDTAPGASSQLDDDTDGTKYVKRQSSVQLTMKRIFPSLFTQQSLPMTTR